mmetsp:Transcript_31198/g.65788  ORF Transcript_31198/g.65788 Transcript_31198/m.65788 type:complete len:94 (-) Transcript_31198:239-520(-)
MNCSHPSNHHSLPPSSPQRSRQPSAQPANDNHSQPLSTIASSQPSRQLRAQPSSPQRIEKQQTYTTINPLLTSFAVRHDVVDLVGDEFAKAAD